MKYIAKYLPVDKPWTDGCTIINSSGEHHTWDEASIGWKESQWKIAELFIVANEFNQQVIICKPSKETQKWLKAGMEVKRTDIVPHYESPVIMKDGTPVHHIECPICGHYTDKK